MKAQSLLSDEKTQRAEKVGREKSAARIEERADELVAVNALAVTVLEKYLAAAVPKEKLRAQHALARQVLPLIFSAERKGCSLSARARARGEPPPANHAKPIGQACDLVDAASVLADVPLISLWRVKTTTGEHNPRAFAKQPAFRRALLDQARRHVFTEADQRAIALSDAGAAMRRGVSWIRSGLIFVSDATQAGKPEGESL